MNKTNNPTKHSKPKQQLFPLGAVCRSRVRRLCQLFLVSVFCASVMSRCFAVRTWSQLPHICCGSHTGTLHACDETNSSQSSWIQTHTHTQTALTCLARSLHHCTAPLPPHDKSSGVFSFLFGASTHSSSRINIHSHISNTSLIALYYPILCHFPIFMS